MGNLKISPFEYGGVKCQFDLIFEAFEKGDSISLQLDYSSELFKEQTARKFIQRYAQVLEQVTAQKDIQLKNIALSHDLLVSTSKIGEDKLGDFGF
ncbi:MAG: hypothetical protein GY765_22700, partial [bacterium]|nr:hypothetical protein [bacterium]